MTKRTRPMTRASRRKQLLEIARQLVAEKGIGALTMMTLSERAKVAKPVVYSHFRDRSAVAVALLDEHFNMVANLVRERLANVSTAEEYFAGLVDAAFEIEGMSDTPVRQITNGFSAGDEVNEAFRRHEERFRPHWETVLTRIGVPREAVGVAAYALQGMTDNTVYTFAITRQRKVAHDVLKSMLVASVMSLMEGNKSRESVLKTPVYAEENPRRARAKRVAPKKRRGAKSSSRRSSAQTVEA